MIELISIVASLAVIVLMPIQTAQIRAGKIGKRFKGTREQYAAAFGKQLRLLLWLGPIFGTLNLVAAFVETEPGEWVVKLVAAMLWFGVFGVAALSLRKLTNVPAAATP